MKLLRYVALLVLLSLLGGVFIRGLDSISGVVHGRFVCARAYMLVYMYACVFMCTFCCVHMHVYVYVYVCACVSRHVRSCICCLLYTSDAADE